MNFMCYGIDIGWSESCQIEKFNFFGSVYIRCLDIERGENINEILCRKLEGRLVNENWLG